MDGAGATRVTGGKWISDLEAQTPAADAAQRVLAIRLEAVRDALGLALARAHEDVEHVHRLRVATRRAGAALDVFRDCLPEGCWSTARKRLRRIRRAAGLARDWDVLLERLRVMAARVAAEERATLDLLIGYAVAHRIPAQSMLETSCPNYPFELQRFMAATVAKVRRPKGCHQTLGDLGRCLLHRLLEELDAAIARDHPDYASLHEVRIVGKRVRYAMEVVVDCFDRPLRKQFYPLVADLQKVLGEINDACVAMALFREFRRGLERTMPEAVTTHRPPLERLIREQEQRLPDLQRRFLQWRDEWRRPETRFALAALLQPETPDGSRTERDTAAPPVTLARRTA